ncbi:hypothetical protein ACN28C_15870 [Plantactinospora sp. WMMC1484]|uniref:hypothetical protein n=1 Tax=Plantactinospora sp. WMMC1484 TaxID=3404122 RepID=UPI003BF45FD1
MSEFYVDTSGLTGLCNLLHQASGDAGETLRYTQTHCDLSSASLHSSSPPR